MLPQTVVPSFCLASFHTHTHTHTHWLLQCLSTHHVHARVFLTHQSRVSAKICNTAKQWLNTPQQYNETKDLQQLYCCSLSSLSAFCVVFLKLQTNDCKGSCGADLFHITRDRTRQTKPYSNLAKRPPLFAHSRAAVAVLRPQQTCRPAKVGTSASMLTYFT